MTDKPIVCEFCQRPARLDLGDTMRMIVDRLDQLLEQPSLGYAADVCIKGALTLLGVVKTVPGYAERYRIYPRRPRIVAHPGCVADWAHDQAEEKAAYEASQNPDTDSVQQEHADLLNDMAAEARLADPVS